MRRLRSDTVCKSCKLTRNFFLKNISDAKNSRQYQQVTNVSRRDEHASIAACAWSVQNPKRRDRLSDLSSERDHSVGRGYGYRPRWIAAPGTGPRSVGRRRGPLGRGRALSGYRVITLGVQSDHSRPREPGPVGRERNPRARAARSRARWIHLRGQSRHSLPRGREPRPTQGAPCTWWP